MHRAAAAGENDDYMTCPSCEKIFASFKPYKGPQAEDDESMDGESPDPFGKRKKFGNKHGGQGSKGCDKLGFEPKVTHSTWVKRSDAGDFPLAPSAKTAALKSILLRGFRTAPMDKVRVSHFTAISSFESLTSFDRFKHPSLNPTSSPHPIHSRTPNDLY
jgi:hypothetical protein